MRFIRPKQAAKDDGISRQTQWRWERAGLYPRKIRIGPNSKAYAEEELEARRAALRYASDQGITDETQLIRLIAEYIGRVHAGKAA